MLVPVDNPGLNNSSALLSMRYAVKVLLFEELQNRMTWSHKELKGF